MKQLMATLLTTALTAGCASTPTASPAAKSSATQPPLISRSIGDRIQRGYEAIGRLYASQDFAKMAAFSSELLNLNPRDPVLTYFTAMLHARAGNKNAALESLGKLAELESDLVPKDDEFSAIAGTEYEAAKARLIKAAPAFKPAAVTFTLPDRELIPEGIAWDPLDGSFFVGSLHKRKIVQVGAKGGVSDFSSPNDGLFSVTGMRVDSRRRLLWVASSAAEGFEINDVGRAAVHKYDLTTRSLIKTYVLGNNPVHLLNDIALAEDGSVYISDSTAGAVWTIGASDELELVSKPGTLVYPNGIVMSPRAGMLYVADYTRGISLVSTFDGKATRLAHPAGLNFHGIDGLYLHDGALIGVQNGAGHGRVIRMPLSSDLGAVTSLEVLHANDPRFEIPTTAAITGKAIHVIANSQLRRIAPDGRLLNPETLQQSVVIEIPLTRGR